jgi:ubiquinone biosynthesis monooxygenase Coq7
MTAKTRQKGGKSAKSGGRPASLPGDVTGRRLLERVIRVDQAGEFGAKQIYNGQLAILKGSGSEAPLREMLAQEMEHLEAFDRLVVDRKIRPTALTPVWRIAGFALGAGTALMGEKAAMACTVAVEEVIEEHYQKQIDALGDDETELRAMLEKFKADEADHRQVGLSHGAEETPGYRTLRRGIKAGTRIAVWLSERV